MTQELGSISDLERLASSLGVPTEDASSCNGLCQKWLEDNPTYTWNEVLVALNKMEERELALEIEKKYKLSSFDLQAANTSTGTFTLKLYLTHTYIHVHICTYTFLICQSYHYYLFTNSFLWHTTASIGW